jgi:hypothetical protein
LRIFKMFHGLMNNPVYFVHIIAYVPSPRMSVRYFSFSLRLVFSSNILILFYQAVS